MVNATLVPRYLEVRDGDLYIAFDLDGVDIRSESWLLAIAITLARLILGDEAIVRRNIGADRDRDGAYVWQAPLQSVSWARTLLLAIGGDGNAQRLPMRIDGGDIVVAWPAKRQAIGAETDESDAHATLSKVVH